MILEPRAFARHLLALLLFALLAVAGLARAADFLEPERAFQFSARAADANSVEVSFDIAPGYYMYREASASPPAARRSAPPALPQGKVKFDETFQKNVETYRDVVRIRIPVTQAGAAVPARRHRPGLRRPGPVLPADAERAPRSG